MLPKRRFYILIPSRALDSGKTRLAPVLGPKERRAFSRKSLRHVATIARAVAGSGQTVVISGSGEVLGLARRLGVRAVAERRPGLNAAVTQGVRFARDHRALAMLVVHADLPEIRKNDLLRALQTLARHGGAMLAPDSKREGTNALALRTAAAFRFHFGPDSFAKHLAEARRRKLRVRVVQCAGLGRDVDTPEDYQALARG